MKFRNFFTFYVKMGKSLQLYLHKSESRYHMNKNVYVSTLNLEKNE